MAITRVATAVVIRLDQDAETAWQDRCECSGKSKVHAEFYEMFLDHSAVAKRHYLTSGEPVPKFDEAVKFFGEQMGFLTTDRTGF